MVYEQFIKTFVTASIAGRAITQLIDDIYIHTFNGTASSNGNDIESALKFIFVSLIGPLIQNMDPNLNPEVIYKVKTIIEVTITLTVKLPDPDGDNAIIKIPFQFFASSSDLIYSKQVGYGPTQVIGVTSTENLTPTSASIVAELGILNLVLVELIPQLISGINGASQVGIDRVVL